MDIRYTIAENCRDTVLYKPNACIKLYNCLTFYGIDEPIRSLRFNHQSNNPNKSFKAKIIRVRDNQIFFGPAFQDLNTIDEYNIKINDADYTASEDDFSVGSLLMPEVELMSRFYKQTQFRVIGSNDSYDAFLNFEAELVTAENTRFYRQPFIEVVFPNNEHISSFVNDYDHLSVQLLDNAKQKTDISLYISVTEGTPFRMDNQLKFKMVLEDLVYNSVQEKYILRNHKELLKKGRYHLSLEDSEGNILTNVNGLDFTEEKIFIDTTTPQNVDKFTINKITKNKVPVLSSAFGVFHRKS